MDKTAAKYKPIKRPPARMPRKRRARPSAHQGYQVGRSVRVWLHRNAGLLSVAIGWAFVFCVLAVPKTADYFVPVIELVICGAGFLGFGVGWQCREESDGEDGRR